MANIQLRRTLNNLSAIWRNSGFEKVFRENLGDFALKEFKSQILLASQFIDQVENIGKHFDDELAKNIIEFYQDYLNYLSSLNNYDDSEFIANRAKILQDIESYQERFNNILGRSSGIITYINNNSATTQPNDFLKEIRVLKEKAEKDSASIQALKQEQQENLDRFDERYSPLLQEAELFKQKQDFTTSAIKYREASNRWLIATIASVLIFVAVLCQFQTEVFSPNKQLDELILKNYSVFCKECNEKIINVEIFKSIALRVLTMSTFLYAIGFCTKNYMACLHNEAINNHRANSLLAALALVDKAKTSEGNDEIMGQAISSIFSHQSTGYNSKPPQNVQLTVIEKIIDKFTSNKQ